MIEHLLRAMTGMNLSSIQFFIPSAKIKLQVFVIFIRCLTLHGIWTVANCRIRHG